MPACPRVTFILLAYRQEPFVRAAVAGALAQDYPNLEILISDDCSPDATFDVIEEVVRGYEGPHTVTATQMPHNVGLAEHLRTVVGRATGELLVLAAGDDISLPQRTSRLVETWLSAGGGPAVLYSDCRMINLTGEMVVERSPVMRRVPPTFAEACRGNLDVHGATSAVTASLFTDFPAIAPDVIHEDRVLPFRALLLGGSVLYVDEALVDYRFEGGVSRMPKDPHEAALFWLNGQRRALADARQRLADLRHSRRADPAAEQNCRATIIDHENAIAFGEESPAAYELAVFKRLASGGRVAPLMHTYLRHRLASLGILRWAQGLRSRVLRPPEDQSQ